MVQWVEEQTLSLLWHGFSPRPRNLYVPLAQPKRERLPSALVRASQRGEGFIAKNFHAFFVVVVVFLSFLGLLPRHMEFPRLGVESEL